MDELPEEVRKRIEENRAKALLIRKQKQELEKKSSKPVESSAAKFFGNRVQKSAAVSAFHRAQNQATSGAKHPQTKVSNQTVTGRCFLISATEFRLQCGYHQKLLELFKTFPSSRLDPVSRHYCFKLEEAEALQKRASECAPEVAISWLPHFIPKILRENTDKLKDDKVELSSVDPKLRKTLMPFQIEGVERGIRQHGKILIADDMGLGKTIQSLAIAAYYREEWPLLVVCPSSMRFSWKEAFLRWLPSLTELDVQVVVKSSEPLGDNQVVITSYDLMSRRSKDFVSGNFKVLIFDESHFLKSYKSQRTKAAHELSGLARRVILLSGTPALSRPIELYPQIQCLAFRKFPHVHEFAVRYCNARETRFGWDYSSSSNLDELHIVLKELLMIRRLKSEVLDQLPAKQRNVLILDPTMVTRKNAQADHYTQLLQDDKLDSTTKRSALLEYFAMSAEMRKKAVCKYVEELLENDCKFLVFAHHRILLDALGEMLEKNKIEYIRIDGRVSSEKRQNLCDQFQTSQQCKVAILSITAANAGITLHAARMVVFAELFWNPGILTQAEDRIHRIGQTQTCLVTYLIARDTADDYIWPIIEGKLAILNQVGLSKDSFSEAMIRKTELTARERSPTDDNLDGSSGSSRKRPRNILDYLSTSTDSFWLDITQDASLTDS